MSYFKGMLINLINIINYLLSFFNVQNKNGNSSLNRTNHNIIQNINGKMYYMYDGSQQILVITDYGLAKEYYKSYNKTIREYKYLGYVYEKLLKNSIGAFTGKNLLLLKKPLVQFFNTGSIKKHFGMIVEETNKWMENTFPEKINKYELQELNLNKLTINIISNIIYGQLSTYDLNELYDLSIIHKELMVIMGQDMSLRIPFIYNNFNTSNKIIVDSFYERWVIFNDKMKNQVCENTLFATLLENDIYIENDDILYQTLYEIMLFNTDIMVDSFANLIWDIVSNKLVNDTILNEVSKINMDYEEINKLEYLINVENESARLNPGIVLTFAETITENITLDGYKIPANTKISINTQMVNKDSNIWIKPDEFNPNRFNKDNPSLYHSYHRFGMGPRKCLGNVSASYILRIGIISILKNFDCIAENNTIKFDKRNTIPNLCNSIMKNRIVFIKKN